MTGCGCSIDLAQSLHLAVSLVEPGQPGGAGLVFVTLSL